MRGRIEKGKLAGGLSYGYKVARSEDSEHGGREIDEAQAARRQGTCVNRASIRRNEVETWIIEAVRHQLMTPDLVAEFVRTFNEETNRMRRERDARRGALEREAKEVERKIDALLDAFASGTLKGENVQAKLESLETRQAQLAAELAGLTGEPVRLHPNLAAVYRRKVAALHELLRDEATRPEAIELIRSLIDRVVIRPASGAGIEIELVGDLAAMVELAHMPKAKVNGPGDRAVHDEFRRSVKVVAGVGFEPTTFRL